MVNLFANCFARAVRYVRDARAHWRWLRATRLLRSTGDLPLSWVNEQQRESHYHRNRGLS